MQKTLFNLFPFILLLLLVVMWGSAFAALKVSLTTIPPLWVMLSRMIIGSLTIATVFLFLKKKLPLTIQFWKWSFLIGFLGFSIPFSVISWGAQYIPSSLVAILMGANPIITLLLSHFFLINSRMSLRMVGGVIVGAIGIILLIGFGNLQYNASREQFIFGQLAVLSGTFSFALASVIIKNSPQEDLFERSLGSLICGSLIGFLIVYFLSKSPVMLEGISLISIFNVCLLGIFPTGVATIIWFKVIALKGPMFLSLVNYLIPIWALILGVLLLNEKVDFIIGFGLIFITIGLWLIEKKN
jgi:drug/metabolite transporter (DMT)-like permease